MMVVAGLVAAGVVSVLIGEPERGSAPSHGSAISVAPPANEYVPTDPPLPP